MNELLIPEMTPEALTAFIAERRGARGRTPNRRPKARTVKALAAAWSVSPEAVTDAILAYARTKGVEI